MCGGGLDKKDDVHQVGSLSQVDLESVHLEAEQQHQRQLSRPCQRLSREGRVEARRHARQGWSRARLIDRGGGSEGC